ncbi:MAG: TolB-like protein/tetratricopeptide (TPR) repeat protein [Rhodothermales bacterium]|jgi:TolB-like protein/tetratricopeptide (TPR) repeat protein
MSFFEELKRRNVFRVGIAYAISAWVLLQIADLVIDNIVAPDWVMHVLMLMVGLGFIVALVIAWAYEMTPEGVKREADVVRDESVTQHTAKKLDVITLAAIGALALLIIGDRFIGSDEAEKGSDTFSGENSSTLSDATDQKLNPTPVSAVAPIETAIEAVDLKSIAVLPLANRSVNPEDAFFAEGMHDEILTRLSRISSLKVISRTSVMGYAGTTKKMAEIGQELKVATLLEGGVQRAGDRVRINVQLIEAATDKHLWAEVYDRDLTADNLFDIQSEITLAISDALQAVLTGEEQLVLTEKPTENIEAYAHYLRAKALASGYGRSEPQIRDSVAIYQAALELDPEFAVAWAALSVDWTELQWQGSGISGELEKAAEALAKAQALAPDSAETLVAEGYLYYWGYLDYEKALNSFEAALDKKPGSVLALRGTAYVLRRMGRLDECISTFRRAIELDPNDAALPADLAYSLLRQGEINEARDFFIRAITQDPSNEWNLWSYSYYFLTMNDLAGAHKLFGPVTSNASEYQIAGRYTIARYMNDTEAMQEIMTAWEGREEIIGASEIAYAQMLYSKGEVDGYRETLIELEKDLLAATSQATRKETYLSELVMLYGLLDDRDKLQQVIHRFETELNPDALRIIEVNPAPYAWTMVGEKSKALDSAEKMVEQFGPWEFYIFILDPIFESLRGEPRYKQLALQYDRWLESVQ